MKSSKSASSNAVSTHSHPKVAAAGFAKDVKDVKTVSTHSHPKVAACRILLDRVDLRGFNTQPPEGGCSRTALITSASVVSTHSHPKVAAPYIKKQDKSAN